MPSVTSILPAPVMRGANAYPFELWLNTSLASSARSTSAAASVPGTAMADPPKVKVELGPTRAAPEPEAIVTIPALRMITTPVVVALAPIPRSASTFQLAAETSTIPVEPAAPRLKPRNADELLTVAPSAIVSRLGLMPLDEPIFSTPLFHSVPVPDTAIRENMSEVVLLTVAPASTVTRSPTRLAFPLATKPPVFQTVPLPLTMARELRVSSWLRLTPLLETLAPASMRSVPEVPVPSDGGASTITPSTDQVDPVPVTRTSPTPPPSPIVASPSVASVPPFWMVRLPVPPPVPMRMSAVTAPADATTVGLGVIVLMVASVVAVGTVLRSNCR